MFSGSNCTAIIAEENYIPSRIPFSCDLSIDTAVRDIDVVDLFTVTAVFRPKLGEAVSWLVNNSHFMTCIVRTTDTPYSAVNGQMHHCLCPKAEGYLQPVDQVYRAIHHPVIETTRASVCPQH